MPRYQESLDIKRRLGDKRGMAASLGEIAQIFEGRGRFTESEQSYSEALRLQEEIGDRAGTSATLVNMSALLIDNLGRPDEALPLLRRALQIRRDAGNALGEALVLNMIGGAYLAKGEFSDAETNFERALAIRQEANVPADIADSLHNLAEASLRMGRYDEALKNYVRALELRGKASDKRGQAIENYSIGTVFDSQGRFGAAGESKVKALNAYRDLKLRDMWLGEILGGLGHSLSSAGRVDEAGKQLDEALNVARELRHPRLITQTLYFQASNALVRGDAGAASALSDQAVQSAKRSVDKGLMLQISTFAALITVPTQPSRAVAIRLANLAKEADALGLRALSVDASIARAVTLLKVGDGVMARQEIERTLVTADALGSKLLLAKGHYARAEILAAKTDPMARAGYATTLRLLNELRAEEGNQNLLDRADLGSIYAACERGAKGT